MKHFYKFNSEAEYDRQKPSMPMTHVALINGVVFFSPSESNEDGTTIDLSNYYTKDEIDQKGYLTSHQDISGKADSSSVYTKTEIDTKVGNVESLLAAL